MLSSRLVIGTVLSLCKLFSFCISCPSSKSKHILIEHISEYNKARGPALHQSKSSQGIITFSNHQSTLDDPLMWSWLPFLPVVKAPKNIRWALGAEELLFLGPISSWFFSSGQVIPIARRNGSKTHSYPTSLMSRFVSLFGNRRTSTMNSPLGLTQSGMINATKLLLEGNWIHVFAEGRVYQTCSDAPILPLKPGCAALIANYYDSTSCAPIVIPILISNFYNLYPANTWIPRFLSARVHVYMGNPEDSGITDTFLQSIRGQRKPDRLHLITRHLNSSLARLYAKNMCQTA